MNALSRRILSDHEADEFTNTEISAGHSSFKRSEASKAGQQNCQQKSGCIWRAACSCSWASSWINAAAEAAAVKRAEEGAAALIQEEAKEKYTKSQKLAQVTKAAAQHTTAKEKAQAAAAAALIVEEGQEKAAIDQRQGQANEAIAKHMAAKSSAEAVLMHKEEQVAAKQTACSADAAADVAAMPRTNAAPGAAAGFPDADRLASLADAEKAALESASTQGMLPSSGELCMLPADQASAETAAAEGLQLGPGVVACCTSRRWRSSSRAPAGTRQPQSALSRCGPWLL